MKRYISINENFLEDEMYRVFKTFAETTDIYDKNINNTVWSQRIVHAPQAPVEIKTIGKEYIKLVRDKIKKDFDIERQIFTDILCFNRWRVGDAQSPHADDANGFEWRKFGCVLYLNDDYEGGEIGFKFFNVSYKPKSGDIILFSSAFPYMHEVKPITKGYRNAAVTWYSYAKL